MQWQFPWPESVKQRLCRYLLQHYLGHYFEEKISLKQINIEILNGKIVLKNINLDCDALNEQFKTLNIPLEIVSGYIGKQLMIKNCLVVFCILNIRAHDRSPTQTYIPWKHHVID
jgi:hypothetical protein